jgi:protein TonB
MIHLAREGAVATAAVGVALLTVCAAPLGQGQNDLPRVPPGMMTFVAEPPPTRLHAGLPVPIKIADATPIYPPSARAAGIAGDVVLEIVIDARGRVRVERVLRSIPALDQAAIDAVTQWRFAPVRIDGAPHAVTMPVTVNFRLRGR